MKALQTTLLRLLFASLIFGGAYLSAAGNVDLPAERRASEFSLSKGSLALGGYDPVAYFQGAPKKGSEAYRYEHRGVFYQFANEANRKTFAAEPSKYEPQYGGWCAWAMYDDGGRTEANPESFKIVDGKLYMFYDGFWGDTRKFWNDEAKTKPEAELITTADQYWESQVK